MRSRSGAEEGGARCACSYAVMLTEGSALIATAPAQRPVMLFAPTPPLDSPPPQPPARSRADGDEFQKPGLRADASPCPLGPTGGSGQRAGMGHIAARVELQAFIYTRYWYKRPDMQADTRAPV